MFNLAELILAVYEKNQNWREEILAIEEKIHFGGFLVNPPKFLAAKISSLKVTDFERKYSITFADVIAISYPN